MASHLLSMTVMDKYGIINTAYNFMRCVPRSPKTIPKPKLSPVYNQTIVATNTGLSIQKPTPIKLGIPKYKWTDTKSKIMCYNYLSYGYLPRDFPQPKCTTCL